MELRQARNNLSGTNNRLRESEISIAQLKENRWVMITKKWKV